MARRAHSYVTARGGFLNKESAARLLLLLLLLSACSLLPDEPPPAPTAVATPTPPPTPIPTRTPNVDAPDPRVETVWIDSQTLGLEKTVYVYTPPGYDPAAEAGYPALYLFRGHEREWINDLEDASRGGENAIDVYEALFEAGEVGAMLLVFPGIGSADNSVPGLLVDFQAPELTRAPGIGSGAFERYFIDEVIPTVETHYATSGARGVDGFSLGGFASTKIALQYPELFHSVGAFDALFFYAEPDCDLDDPRDTVFDAAMFAPAFGSPRDVAYATAQSPASLLCATPTERLADLVWLIQFGPEGAEPHDANYYRGAHFLSFLETRGLVNQIDPILEGGHNWDTADEHLRQVLPLHWQALR